MASDNKRKRSGRSALGIIFGILFFLFWRIDSWLCSVPMWLTLILHFTVGLPIVWFWATLAVWILVGVIRYLLIMFARWGSNQPEPEKKNMNPYSLTKEERKYNEIKHHD